MISRKKINFTRLFLLGIMISMLGCGVIGKPEPKIIDQKWNGVYFNQKFVWQVRNIGGSGDIYFQITNEKDPSKQYSKTVYFERGEERTVEIPVPTGPSEPSSDYRVMVVGLKK